jgi:C1A family cysteine protease
MISRSTFTVRPDRPDNRDLVCRFDQTKIKNKVDLRDWCSPIEDQLHLGSCVGQAVVGAFELMVNRLFKDRFVDLSRLFVYYNARAYDNMVDEDAGTYVRYGIKSVNHFGVCAESIWPYITYKFSEAPSLDSYMDARTRMINKYYRVKNLDDILYAVNLEYPVVISMSVYNSFYDLELPGKYELPLPQAYEQIIGGHAVTVVGYDLDQKKLIIRNSFGEDWGEKGYFYMPFDYIKNNVWDSWMFDIAMS